MLGDLHGSTYILAIHGYKILVDFEVKDFQLRANILKHYKYQISALNFFFCDFQSFPCAVGTV